MKKSGDKLPQFKSIGFTWKTPKNAEKTAFNDRLNRFNV
jgi:hypothetical protein